MLIVIAGAGRVGLGVAEALIKEQKNDVVLIDSSSRAVKNAQAFDMLVLHGNVLDRSTMIEAGIERADVFISATDVDDRNVLACGLAKHLRERRSGDARTLTTICRIRDEHILDEQAHGGLAAWAEVDRAIDPIDGAISRLSSGIRASSFAEVIPFDHDAYLVELEVTPNCRLPLEIPLGDVVEQYEGEMPLLIGLKREGQRSFVPGKATMLHAGDHIAIATTGLGSFDDLVYTFGHDVRPFPDEPKVVVVGGGSLGQRIARRWLDDGAHVMIVERDLNLANAISGQDIGGHARLEVIHGDHLSRETMVEVGMGNHDVAIGALDDDHANIAAMLFAMDLGVPNTGIILNDNDLVHVVHRMGISFAVDITRVAVDELLSHVHRKMAGHYAVLSTIPNVVGVTHEVTKAAKFCGRKIRDGGFPDWLRIAFIQRSDSQGRWSSYHPNPDEILIEHDRLIIFTSPDRVADVEKRFRV
jgi:trk system potassium uptake protein TrkA